MTDYIFLKISEMALRAIDRPRRGPWVYYTRLGDHYSLYDTHPQLIRKGRSLFLLRFPTGTCCYNPILHGPGTIMPYAEECGNL